MKITHFLRFFVVLFCLTSFACSSSKKEKDNSIEVSAQKIIKKISEGKPLILKDKVIKGTLDFTKVEKNDRVLPVSYNFVESSLTFVNCTFEDSVCAFFSGTENNMGLIGIVFNKDVNFYGCKFLKGVNFTQSRFNGNFSFELSNVANKAAFDGAKFSGAALFASANFQDDCSFVSCKCLDKTSFFKTLFKKSMIVQGCTFSDMIYFCNSIVNGYFEFSDNKVLSKTDFSYAKFSSKMRFANNMFYSLPKTSDVVVGDCEYLDNSVLRIEDLKDNIFN